MATAIWNVNEHTDNSVKSAFNWISKANKALPNDKSIKALFDEIKEKHDKIIKREK